ncbi:LysE/ArgO family amino acid transporter [Curtobacterium sp. MCBA15_004]|uniref:LysE/ArgO family amino acid transporter n=1 Tax=unclassified Curtobacterium TaxID=257496 RepID=UPI0008DDCC80|nr:LysE family transporter [Curtobacterium sp. MCBA15_004]WIA96672.1 LysE family transporter [Curtobacterium sp. MCBA15_004]
MDTLLPLLAGLGTGLALIVAIGVQNAYLLRLAVSTPLRVVVAAVAVCALSDAVLIVAGVLGVGVVVERFPVALVVVRFLGAAFLLTYGVLAARRALRPSGDAMRVDPVADDGTPDLPTTDDAERADLAAPDAMRADRAAHDAARGEPAAVRAEPAAGQTAVARAGVAATTTGTAPSGRTRVAPPGRTVATTRTAVPTMRTAVLTMLVFTWANPHVYLDTLVFLGSVANQQGVDDRWWWTVGAVAASCVWFGALGFGGRLLRPLFARPLTWRVFDGLVAVVMLSFGALLAVGA